MKVILKVDVDKVGKKDQIVEVSDGYGANFLIKRGMAVIANDHNLDQLKRKQKERADREEQLRLEAVELANKMSTLVVELTAKKGKDGKMFGSVSNKAIEQELVTMGYRIDKRKIEGKGVSEFGSTKVRIELYKNVYATITVKVSEKL